MVLDSQFALKLEPLHRPSLMWTLAVDFASSHERSRGTTKQRRSAGPSLSATSAGTAAVTTAIAVHKSFHWPLSSLVTLPLACDDWSE